MKTRNMKLTEIRRDQLGCPTQQAFADLTGLHKQTIIKLETGGRPSHYTLKVLDKVFKKHGIAINPLDIF